MSEPRFDPAIVHVHGPRFPHDPVEIFGTTAGLERLINALIDAVNLGRGCSAAHARDGSDVELRAACLDGPRREEDWRRSGSPYLDVDDPLVARILDLTEENARLRQTVLRLRVDHPAGRGVDALGAPRAPE